MCSFLCRLRVPVYPVLNKPHYKSSPWPWSELRVRVPKLHNTTNIDKVEIRYVHFLLCLLPELYLNPTAVVFQVSLVLWHIQLSLNLMLSWMELNLLTNSYTKYILQLRVACWGGLAWRCKTYLEPIHYEDQCSKQDELWLSISSKFTNLSIINFANRDDVSSTLYILTLWIVDHNKLTNHLKKCHTLRLYCMALKVYFFCLLSIYHQKMILHWFHFQPYLSWQYWEILER